MSDPGRIPMLPMLVDGVVHSGGSEPHGAMACGLVVYNRSLDAIMKMYIEGTGRDVDCMTCLVAEARERKSP